MEKESKTFSIMDVDQYEQFTEPYQGQFPFLDQAFSHIWRYIDYQTGHIAVWHAPSSIEVIVPSNSDLFKTISVKSEWSPSILDARGYLGIGRRITNLKLIKDKLLRATDHNYALMAVSELFTRIPFNGAFATEDFKFERTQVSYDDNGSLELPRTLPPSHHAVISTVTNGMVTDLLGVSLTGEMERSASTPWEDQLYNHLERLMKKPRRRTRSHFG